MSDNKKPDIEVLKLPKSVNVYASVVHWVTIVSCLIALFAPIFILLSGAHNGLNPHTIFQAIFEGKKPEEIWALSETGKFLGAHSYITYPGLADSWALFGLNLGCAVGMIALVPTVIIQLVKEKDHFYAFLGIVMAVLITLSMLGILSVDM